MGLVPRQDEVGVGVRGLLFAQWFVTALGSSYQGLIAAES